MNIETVQKYTLGGHVTCAAGQMYNVKGHTDSYSFTHSIQITSIVLL